MTYCIVLDIYLNVLINIITFKFIFIENRKDE